MATIDLYTRTVDSKNHDRLRELTAAVADSAEVARGALADAERAVRSRNVAVRAATDAGVAVGNVVSASGLSRADVYRIIDQAES